MEEDLTRLWRALGAAGILTFLLGVGTAAHIVGQEQRKPTVDLETHAAISAAASAAEAWLREVDAARYVDSWERAAAPVRTGVSSAKWEQSLRAARQPLGKLTSRAQMLAVLTTSLPGAPD